MNPGNPTHSAWIEKMRPIAERAIAKLWKCDLRAAILWRTPKKLDSKGHLTDGIETRQSRLKDFDQLRSQLVRSLSSAAFESARALAASSEFRDAIYVALTRNEAVELFAGFLAGGDNAWADSNHGSGIISICFWRE